VRATALGVRNIQRVARLIEPATTDSVGATYEDLEEIYNRVVGQWAPELGHVARIPGGEYKQEKVVGQKGQVYTPIPRARQKAAVAFLNQNAFVTPTFLLDASILRKIEPAGSIDRVGAAQRRVLNTLLDNSRLQRMIEIEGFATRATPALSRADVYPLGEMLGDVRRGVWGEIYRGQAIDPYRRRLQTTYLDLLGAKINPPAPAAPLTIPGSARSRSAGRRPPTRGRCCAASWPTWTASWPRPPAAPATARPACTCRGRATRSRRSCSPKAPRGAERADPESAEGGRTRRVRPPSARPPRPARLPVGPGEHAERTGRRRRSRRTAPRPRAAPPRGAARAPSPAAARRAPRPRPSAALCVAEK
jgi:hypothetical protein